MDVSPIELYYYLKKDESKQEIWSYDLSPSQASKRKLMIDYVIEMGDRFKLSN